MRLSPLNFYGIRHRDPVISHATGSRREVEEITMYLCPVCNEAHENKIDAECCCEEIAEGTEAFCPVCNEKFDTHRDAADCCLWKDLDIATRWKVADQVENGSTWQEALGLTQGNQ